MTDDPRLDAAARAWEAAAAKVWQHEDFDQATSEAGLILAVIDADRAFLGEDADPMTERRAHLLDERNRLMNTFGDRGPIAGGIAEKHIAEINRELGEPPHSETREVLDNATAPAPVVGVDPPWLDEAVLAAWAAWGNEPAVPWRAAVRAMLRVVNAQPVSEKEVNSAANAILGFDTLRYSGAVDTARAALEAAAKVRARG